MDSAANGRGIIIPNWFDGTLQPSMERDPSSSKRTGAKSDQERCQPFGLREGGRLTRKNILSM